MKMDEIEEIRKYWIDPETKRAWDIFADSSKAFYAAKKDIPTLLSALEAAQEENKGLREELKHLAEMVIELYMLKRDNNQPATALDSLIYARANSALSRTEKEGRVSVEPRKLPEQTERVETGVIQFGSDWPGVFIRGDNAFYLAAHLLGLIKHAEDKVSKSAMEGLYELLSGSQVGNAGGLPSLKSNAR